MRLAAAKENRLFCFSSCFLSIFTLTDGQKTTLKAVCGEQQVLALLPTFFGKSLVKLLGTQQLAMGR